MASLSFLGDDDVQFDSAKPFRGVVICCTSIPPELRVSLTTASVPTPSAPPSD